MYINTFKHQGKCAHPEKGNIIPQVIVSTKKINARMVNCCQENCAHAGKNDHYINVWLYEIGF